MARRVIAGLAGVTCAALGAWAGQRLGGNSATAGVGAAAGAVSGAFAPSITGWLSTRANNRNIVGSTAELPTVVQRPSRLLDPRRKVVEFTGRNDELADLTAWCESTTAPTLRLIIGPGGIGKTRLAMRFADYAHDLGWHCHWVGDGQEADALVRVRAVNAGRVLLIIDYAETRRGLPSLLRAAAADHGAALRILLLARAADPWWDQLVASEPAIRDLITAAGPDGCPLSRAVANLTDEQLVLQAIPAFARELKTDPPKHLAITLRPGRARVLDLHVGALVGVLNSIQDPATSPVRVSFDDVLGELLRHEERFWLGTAKTSGLLEGPTGLTSTAIRRIVAVGCLLGAADEAEALSLLERVPDVPRSTKLAEWLRSLYPPDPDSGEWLGVLQPDRLAERHIITQLDSSPAFAQRCLTGLSERQAHRVMILLARTYAEQDTEGQLLEQLLRHAHRETLISIANAISWPNITLSAAYAAITRRILDTLPPDAHPAERGTCLDSYGNALQQLGRHADALAATQEAVTIWRDLATTNPARFRPNLAHILHNLGVRLSDLDRHTDAVSAAQEAVTIYRDLAATKPDQYKLDLADSLTSLGATFSDLGRHTDALSAAQEAVIIVRDLQVTEPAHYLYRLAHSLDHLGVTLSALGRHTDALTAAQAAVGAYRTLAAFDPDRYRAGLARSLDHLGVTFSALGHHANALPPTHEAVTIRRNLAATSPDSYRHRLARSLDHLGATFSALGRHADGAAAIQEAVTIYRKLAAAEPEHHRPNLAHSLINLGAELFRSGNYTDALTPTQEAATILGELAVADPDRHQGSRATALRNLGATFSVMGRNTDALAPTQEAVAILRSLAAANPDHYRTDLVSSIGNLAGILSKEGSHADAEELRMEANRLTQGP